MTLECSSFETNPAWGRIPKHKFHVLFCCGNRCLEKGAKSLFASLVSIARERGIIEVEGGILITRTHCQYPCNLGPILTVYPDGVWYRVQSTEDVRRIVDEHFITGSICEDLIVQEDNNDHE